MRIALALSSACIPLHPGTAHSRAIPFKSRCRTVSSSDRRLHDRLTDGSREREGYQNTVDYRVLWIMGQTRRFDVREEPATRFCRKRMMTFPAPPAFIYRNREVVSPSLWFSGVPAQALRRKYGQKGQFLDWSVSCSTLCAHKRNLVRDPPPTRKSSRPCSRGLPERERLTEDTEAVSGGRDWPFAASPASAVLAGTRKEIRTCQPLADRVSERVSSPATKSS